VVDVARFAAAVEADTTVAALMLVNNEIGTLMPVAEAARAIRDRNPGVHIHCDAVQALGKVPLAMADLGVDSAAFAAHKIHGPKGAGALWLARSARIAPMWSGGGQQEGVRSGTLNVPGIAGLGEAAERAVRGLDDARARFTRFAATLLDAARRTGVPFRHNGGDAPRAPHVVSLAFDGVPAEPLLHVLESRGVLVSAGSACAERDRKPSPVLTAIGLPRSFGTVRLSFGRDTSQDDVDRAAGILVEAVRSFS
jgi:cysteine desulfurase